MKDTAFAVDEATVLTTIFVIVTEVLKEPHAVRALARPGPKPICPDAEIITVALYQELVGDPREDHFYRLQAKDLRSYFPALPSRSRYNRRKRNLAWIILLVWQFGTGFKTLQALPSRQPAVNGIIFGRDLVVTLAKSPSLVLSSPYTSITIAL